MIRYRYIVTMQFDLGEDYFPTSKMAEMLEQSLHNDGVDQDHIAEFLMETLSGTITEIKFIEDTSPNCTAVGGQLESNR